MFNSQTLLILVAILVDILIYCLKSSQNITHKSDIARYWKLISSKVKFYPFWWPYWRPSWIYKNYKQVWVPHPRVFLLEGVINWKIQLNAIITRSIIVRYLINNYRNSGRISIKCWIHKKTPHTSPQRASYGVSFVNICEQIDRVVPRNAFQVTLLGPSTCAAGLHYSDVIMKRGKYFHLMTSSPKICDENEFSIVAVTLSKYRYSVNNALL